MPPPRSGGGKAARANPFEAAARAAAVLALTALLFLAFLASKSFARGKRQRFAADTLWTRRWACALTCAMGLRVTVRGPHPPRGALLAPNHQGYVDILAMASVTRCFFIPKADLARWPLIGWLIRASDHPVVTRARSRDLAETAAQARERLEAGQSVCVFLEGTSSGGAGVLPFRAPLLRPALEARAPIVPVAIRWRPRRAGARVEEDIAYWKDHVMGPHLWRLLGLGGADAQITFGEPVTPEPDADRKSLAEDLRRRVCALYGVAPGGEPSSSSSLPEPAGGAGPR